MVCLKSTYLNEIVPITTITMKIINPKIIERCLGLTPAGLNVKLVTIPSKSNRVTTANANIALVAVNQKAVESTNCSGRAARTANNERLIMLITI